jgi:ribosomal protein S18 acetylase RimI-like enzyme
MTAIRPAGVADRERTVAIVADAFATDPVVRWIFPNDATYPDRARAFFGFLFDSRVTRGGVWVSAGGEAAALWSPPGGDAEDEREWGSVAAGFTAAEVERCDAWDAAVAPHHPEGDQWYLGVLATAPEHQGRGHGSAVAAPGLAAATTAGVPAFLETAVERNVVLYERLGFVVTGEIDDPALPRGWCMRRV